MTTAEQYAAQSKIGFDEWCKRVQGGYRGKPYNYKTTPWYKAGRALEKPSAPPPPKDLEALARNVMFTAWSPTCALRAPFGWKLAFSADPAYDTAATSVARLAKQQEGRVVAAWGNQTQIGADRLKSFAAKIGADYIIWQAETPAEYGSALANNATVIVGDPNAWTQSQRDDAIGRVKIGSLAVIFEVYSNDGGQWPEAASSQGVPVASECLGVGWGRNKLHLADYRPHTPEDVWATKGVYLAEGMSGTDWAML